MVYVLTLLTQKSLLPCALHLGVLRGQREEKTIEGNQEMAPDITKLHGNIST